MGCQCLSLATKGACAVSIRDQAQTMAGSRTLLGAQCVMVLTPVLQSIVVKLKSLMIATKTCKHSIYSHTPMSRSSFFHLSTEMKTAPGCMAPMQTLDLGSRTLLFFSQGSGSVPEAAVCAAKTWCVTAVASMFPRAHAGCL